MATIYRQPFNMAVSTIFVLFSKNAMTNEAIIPIRHIVQVARLVFFDSDRLI